MRFIFGSLLLLAVSAAAQQIDPTTQIAWPYSSGNGFPTATCAAANYGQPYTDSTNLRFYQCGIGGWFQVSSGSGAPQGNVFTLQFNNQGAFGGAPTVTYNTALQQFNTLNVFGWQPGAPQFQYSYANQNRDLQLNSQLLPPMFNEKGNGDMSTGDGADHLIQEIMIAKSQQTGMPKTVKTGGGAIFFSSAHALAVIGHDFGDYMPVSTGSGGAVGLTINNGKIVGCSGSGGSLYNPNSSLPVQIIDDPDSSGRIPGSGGAVHATTNGSGVVTGCVVDLPGMNYNSINVRTYVIPIGADGFTGTVALSGGTFGATTVTTGGNGYSTTTGWRFGVPVGSALVQCTGSYPAFTGTVASGQVATVTTSVAGSGCTYNGNATATVPLIAGASCGGSQCTNVSPETPQTIPIAIPLFQGLTIDCEGGSLGTSYPSGLADNSELWLMGDPWGNQGQQITIKNCNLIGFGDAWFAGQVNDVVFDHVTFGARAMGANGEGGVYQGPGASMGIYVASSGTGPHPVAVTVPQAIRGLTVKNSHFLGNIGVYCGGTWNSRNPGVGGTASLGGIDISNKATINQLGTCDNIHIEDTDMVAGTNGQIAGYVYQTLPPVQSQTFNSYSLILDNWVESTLWRTQNQPNTNAFAPNGTGTCPITTTVVSRAADFNFGNPGISPTAYPWFACFRGGSDMVLEALGRYGYNSSVDIQSVTRDYGIRPIVVASLQNFNIESVKGTAGNATYTDPYIPSGAKQPGLIDIEDNISPTGTITAIRNGDTNRATFSQTLFESNLNAADYTSSLAAAITPVNGQAPYFAPTAGTAGLSTNQNYGGVVSAIPSNGTSSVLTGLGLNAASQDEVDYWNAFISSSRAAPNFAFWTNTGSGYARQAWMENSGIWDAPGFRSIGTPSAAPASGAGSGATAVASGQNMAGYVVITAGTGTAAGPIATVTFSPPLPFNPTWCSANMVGQTGTTLAGPYANSPSTAGLTINTLVAIPASQTYTVGYSCYF